MKVQETHPFEEQTLALKNSIVLKLGRVADNDLRKVSSLCDEGVTFTPDDVRSSLGALARTVQL